MNVKIRLMRVGYVALLSVGMVICLVRPLSVSAEIPQPFIADTQFLGLPEISNTAYGQNQTALRTGDATTFRVCVHDVDVFPTVVSADLTELGFPGLTTAPVGPSGASHLFLNSNDYFPCYFFDFGPLTISETITDGLKTIPLTYIDMAGGVATASAQVIVDNVPPSISLTNISFSAARPHQGDFMYFSGTFDGTGSGVRAAQLKMSLTNTDGSPRMSSVVGSSALGYDPKPLDNAFLTSADGTFSNVPVQLVDFGDSGWIADAANFSVDISVHDEAGFFAAATLTAPVPQTLPPPPAEPPPPPPPDPCATPGSCASNVLFLPGIEGSRLYEGTGCGKAAEEKLWEPLGDSNISILRGAGDKKVANLSLDETGKSVCNDIYAKDSDVMDSVHGSNIYSSFIGQMNGLKNDGTITDWKPVAYDWRLSLEDLLTKGSERDGKIYYEEATSTAYIEQTLRSLAASSKSGKVTIVAHSNGGLVVKALLNRLGDTEAAKLVDKIVMVGVPQSGAPEDIGATLFGYDAGIYQYGFPIVSDAAVRSFTQNSPMAYHLLPSEDYLQSTISDSAHPIIRFSGDAYAKEKAAYGNTIGNHMALDDFLLAKDGGREKPTANDLKSAEILNPSLITYANAQHDTLDFWTPPPSIEVDQIAGWGVDTIAGVDFYSLPAGSILGSRKPVREYRPIIMEDGDGIVPVPSALMIASSTNVKRYWVDLDSYRKATSIKLSHRDLFEIPSLEDLIKNIINSGTSTLPAYISNSQPTALTDNKKLTFFLHSPLTLQLADVLGNVTGLAENGSITQDIPNSTYGEFGEVKYITVPEGSQYQLTLHGQAMGTFSLDMQESSGDIITNSSIIANIPTTENTLASLTISNGLDTASPLSIDENGDGMNTIIVAPKVGETVSYELSVRAPESVPAQRTAPAAGSISIPLVGLIPPIATASTSTTTTYSAAIVTPGVVISKKPTITTAKKSTLLLTVPSKKVGTNISQTASVYNAVSQQSGLKRVSAAVYNSLHGFWAVLKKLF